MNEVAKRVSEVIVNQEHLCVLTVAIGHVHDLLYDKYDEHMDFFDRDRNIIMVRTMPTPDRFQFTIANGEICIVVDSMESTILNSLPSSEILTDHQITTIADTLSALYLFMVDEGLTPEECIEYG